MNTSIHVDLTDHPIDLHALQSKIDDPDVGAHGWFLGVTRRTTGGRVTDRLSYEAHRAMAKKHLAELAEEARERFSLRHVVVVHRLGDVPVGQASVAVGCSSAHRVEAFQALPWIMDKLKRDTPIWKQESYVDGSREWVHPTGPATDSTDDSTGSLSNVDADLTPERLRDDQSNGTGPS